MAIVGNMTYTWDANKNKTSESITGVMSGYGFTAAGTTYDFEDRLTGFSRAATSGPALLSQSWNLTTVGDWTSVTTNGTAQNRTHGPTHELLTAGGQNVTTDVKGNITTLPANLRPAGATTALNLTWDSDNKLRSADIDANGTADVNFQYDALGRRVARTGTGGSVVFVQMDQQTIADYPVGGAATTPTFRYVYASYIDEPVVRKGPTSTSTAHFYHRNHQYSVTAITTSTGAIAERYAYTAYGQPTILNASGSVISATTLTNRYTYTGREWDATLGLHHFRARWMSPSAGRFLGRDPIGYEAGDANVYRFALGNAPIGLDPLGLEQPWQGYPGPHTRPTPLPPPPPAPPVALTTLCAGIGACPDCDAAICAAAQKEIQDAFNRANGAALGTLNGWLEERGLGSYGGRCHYWSAEFCKDRNCKPINLGSCLNVIGHIIRLDGNSRFFDHNVNVIKNRCSGKCTVVDDGFWGTLGQVYDPCNVPTPPLVGPIGQGQWDAIRANCGCGGGTSGGAPR